MLVAETVWRIRRKHADGKAIRETAVTTVFVGYERVSNRQYLVMADHHMAEPTAFSPAAEWEKRKVENPVQMIRSRFF